ncbi:MAG: hypothetical protein Ta2E_04300 [Mycoplasmoidaceae bacterium]|nr:MAG: hypothetical protein Ta2E_04300 [Mycoplasmoidaceae bacterium]
MKLKPIQLTEIDNRKAIKKRNLRVFLTGLIATTVIAGTVTALSFTVLKQKSIPPTAIEIRGDNEIFSTGDFLKKYTVASEGPAGHENATDITWEVVGTLPGFLSFNTSTGELSGDVPYNAHGTFSIKASSPKYDLSNILEITVETPTIDPNEIIINGVDEITTIGGVNEHYTFSQFPNGSNVVDNVVWEIWNTDRVTQPSLPLFGTLNFIQTSGIVATFNGTLAEGDSGTFIIRATADTTQYPNLHNFTPVVGEMIVRIDSQKQNPTSLEITGPRYLTTNGSTTEVYGLSQNPNDTTTTNEIDPTVGLWSCNNLPSYLSFDSTTRTLSGTIPYGSNDTFTIYYETTQFGQTWHVEKEIEVTTPKAQPSSMTIIGNNFIDTTDVNEEYRFTQFPIADSSTEEITDAVWSVVSTTNPDIASRGLTFDTSNGRFAGTVPAGVQGTVTIKVRSINYAIEDTFDITFDVPQSSPTLTIHGATTSDAAPTVLDVSSTSGVLSQTYTFTQDPVGSSEVFNVTDAVWSGDSRLTAAGLAINPSTGELSGTISSGQDVTFNITVESASHTASTRTLGIRVFYGIEISTLITSLNLGSISDNNENTIWNKIGALNALPVDIDATIFDWDINSNGAHLYVKEANTTYVGVIAVSFTLP